MAVAAALAAVSAKREHEKLEPPSLARANRPSGSDLAGLGQAEAATGTLVAGRRFSNGNVAENQGEDQRPSSTKPRRSSIDELLESLAGVVQLEEPPAPRGSARWVQQQLRRRYESRAVQMGVATLIASNFLVSAVQAQMAETMTDAAAVAFFVVEYVFAVAFTMELMWNLGAYWLRPFWSSGWNVFDVVIVGITWLSLIFTNLPGISVLRLFRAFRVFRLFKRVESLRNIIEGVFASLPAVGNAFVVLGILMGIWSIIGVEFFADHSKEEFATFLQAMFTMWQIMTLDGWGAIARPLIYNSTPQNEVAAPVFFVTYTFIAAIVMANVVIAILLDNYLKAIDRAKEEKEEAEALKKEEDEKKALEVRKTTMKASPTSGAQSLDESIKVLDAPMAVEMTPTLIPQIMGELCAPKRLQQLPREELLDLATILFSHPLTRDRLLFYAHAKVQEGKVPLDTLAGDLLRCLSSLHLEVGPECHLHCPAANTASANVNGTLEGREACTAVGLGENEEMEMSHFQISVPAGKGAH